MTQFEDTYQLEIAEAYPEDEGTYTFVASNAVGQVSSTASLRLEGKDFHTDLISKCNNY